MKNPKLSIRTYLAPPKDMPLTQWSEENLILSGRQPTAYPGPMRLRITPYAYGIMDALDDPMIHTVVLQAGAQTGKTQIGFAWVVHCIAEDPGPGLIVYPAEDMARGNSLNRLQPLFLDSPNVAKILPTDLKTYFQNLQYRLNGCVWVLTGANSPAQLSSRPIRYLLIDECDKCPQQTGVEADALSLAIQRTKTYWNKKILLVSTPTVPDGPIHRHYLRGDQRKYNVPCPHCGTMQHTIWSQVKWDTDKPDTAGYTCVKCDKKWTETQRRLAISQGEWVASTNGEPGVASFHLSSLSAIWTSLPDLARKFLRTKSSPVELQDFINSDLAEPFIQSDLKIKDDNLHNRETDYLDGTMYYPKEVETAVFGGVDVQQNEFVVVFRQFTRQGDSALIYKDRLHIFADIDALATKYNATGVCIDCRYRSNEVYEASLAYQGFWPVIGVPSFRVPALFEVQQRNVDEGRRGGGGRTVDVMVANSNALLTMLADRIAHLHDGIPDWWLFQGATLDDQYVREMTAMYRSNGVWLNPRKIPDHYTDAEKLCLLAAEYAGFKRSIIDLSATNEPEEEK